MQVRCPAKVNLYLRVVGRRPDGYHELVTVMQPLTLADTLTVTLAGKGISLRCDRPDLPSDEANLVWRAARQFQEETGLAPGISLRLSKRIPVAAGLGGGSSDAAGTLLALNELAGRPLPPDRLHRLASRLGADVPFFLAREPAVGRGTGTQLSPVTLLPYWYLLVNPGVPLSTRWVYENLDLAGLAGPPATEAWDPEHPETWVRNDLGTVALRRFPELAELLAGLSGAGAWCQGISGSGPTLFGLFPTREAAYEAGLNLRRTFRGWLAVARGLTGPEPETSWEHHVWMI
jgi:4-diphosphocytidyl-2-C-methyl-D-erythritol kinase